MKNTPANQLWTFLAEFYDDWITDGQRGSLILSARIVRVLGRIWGKDTLEQSLSYWQAKGDLRAFGDCEDLGPDAACIELTGYPSNIAKTAD